MNPTHSTAEATNEYQPTIIETGLLIERLAIQFAFLRDELKLNWIEFNGNPTAFLRSMLCTLAQRLRKLLSTPYVLRALSTAVTAVVCLVVAVLLFERTSAKPGNEVENTEQAPLEIVMLSVQKQNDAPGFGRNGTGLVGLQRGSGEGSGPKPQHAGGGGSGGDGTPLPAQAGEVPPPSPIAAAIPITPPLNPPVLPAAGIDFDPAIWQDLKKPVYGDPLSESQLPSKGPGTGEGIGTRSGTGVGDGLGPGFGPGTNGNTGIGDKQIGCCGPGGSQGNGNPNGDGGERGFGGGALKRARVLHKP